MGPDVISMDGYNAACRGTLGEVLANYGPAFFDEGCERQIYQRIGSVVDGQWVPLPPKPATEPYFYMLYAEGGGAPTVPHSSREAAEAEAERITRLRGKKVYVLEATACAESVKAPVAWLRRA